MAELFSDYMDDVNDAFDGKAIPIIHKRILEVQECTTFKGVLYLPLDVESALKLLETLEGLHKKELFLGLVRRTKPASFEVKQIKEAFHNT